MCKSRLVKQTLIVGGLYFFVVELFVLFFFPDLFYHFTLFPPLGCFVLALQDLFFGSPPCEHEVDMW